MCFLNLRLLNWHNPDFHGNMNFPISIDLPCFAEFNSYSIHICQWLLIGQLKTHIEVIKWKQRNHKLETFGTRGSPNIRACSAVRSKRGQLVDFFSVSFLCITCYMFAAYIHTHCVCICAHKHIIWDRAGEMSQQLVACTPLAKDQSLVPAPIWWLTIDCNSRSGGCLLPSVCTCTHAKHTRRHTHMNKMIYFRKDSDLRLLFSRSLVQIYLGEILWERDIYNSCQ